MMNMDRISNEDKLVTDHRRQWRACRYVYPVISRRAGGLSIGVNLNIDKQCNFRCVYCQINRKRRREPMAVDLPRLQAELNEVLTEAKTGRLWQEDRFASTPPAWRRMNDIAFSGDGEPTCRPNFDQAVATAAEALREHGLTGTVKIVVITNASLLDAPQVGRALPILSANGGELWAKLDAGTEKVFHRVNRPAPGLTLDKICRNILSVAKEHPVVLQTLFFRTEGQPPTESEILAYAERIRTLRENGGNIRLVQIHTVARNPAERFVSFLPEADLRAIADRLRAELPDLPLEVYPGVDVPPQE